MKKKLLLMALFAISGFSSFAQIEANPVPDIVQCNNEVFDLTVQEGIAIGDLDPAILSVSYFTSEADAITNMNPIVDPEQFILQIWPEQLIYLRLTDNTGGNFDIVSFVITIHTTPYMGDYMDVTVCGSYQLPYNEEGSYYTAPGGGGEMLAVGTVITSSQTIYIYNSNSCGTAETSFDVTITGEGIIIPPLEPLIGCDDNGDNIVFFDLEYVFGDLFTEYEVITNVGVYETFEDAVNGVNPIPNINEYVSILEGVPTVFFRVEQGDCITILPLELIAEPCDTDNTISGVVTYDADGDGCNETDLPAAGVMVYYGTGGNIFNYAYTDSEGYYTFYNVPNTTVNVYVDTFYPIVSDAAPATYSYAMPGNITDANFCLSAPEPVTDVSVYLVETSAAQPGFPATYALIYQNGGNTVASGEVTIEFNDTQLDFVATSSPNLLPSGSNTLTLTYSDLQPFGYEIVYLDFLVAMPGIVDLGDTITFTSTITPLEGDAYPENNVNVLNQISVNSWDPNDYMVYEGAEITMDQAGDYLTYRIRFQNVGTANATFVTIETELDDKLDWDTFQPLSASHDYVTHRTDNDIEFFFDDIQLAGAEINEPESHGFIIFRIKPKANVQVGDIMDGQAFNFFDFNDAMPTNVVSTEIVELAGMENNGLTNFTIYPNPASSSLTVDFADETVEAFNLIITDALGKTVLKSSYNTVRTDINISSLGSGVYFVTTSANGKQATKKLIVK